MTKPKKPKRCWGKALGKHVKGCRPGRPLCRWMREIQAAKYGVCLCGAYPFPHRAGGGRCGDDQAWVKDYLRDAKIHGLPIPKELTG